MIFAMQRLEAKAGRAFNAKKPGGHDVNKEFDWLISTTTNHTLSHHPWVIVHPCTFMMVWRSLASPHHGRVTVLFDARDIISLQNSGKELTMRSSGIATLHLTIFLVRRCGQPAYLDYGGALASPPPLKSYVPRNETRYQKHVDH